jgi:hypothetical protein
MKISVQVPALMHVHGMHGHRLVYNSVFALIYTSNIDQHVKLILVALWC